MKEITVFTTSTGLNTVADPVRLPYDPEAGVSDLAAAVNVTVTQQGRINRRDGFAQVQAGSFHSLFCDGGACLVARTTSLYQVGADMSLTGLRSGMSGDRIAYAQVNNETYYTNGTQNGVVRGGVSSPWPTGSAVDTDGVRRFSPAPVGNHLAFFASRMFVSVGDTLWWSEPFGFGMFDMARSFVRLPSKILMVKPVAGGVYLSDLRDTYFLRGAVPKEFVLEKVASFPAYEWSDAIEYVEGMDVGLQAPGLCAMWASPEGAVLGTPTGAILNLNKDKIIYPEGGRQGASLVRGYNFIHAMG